MCHGGSLKLEDGYQFLAVAPLKAPRLSCTWTFAANFTCFAPDPGWIKAETTDWQAVWGDTGPLRIQDILRCLWSSGQYVFIILYHSVSSFQIIPECVRVRVISSRAYVFSHGQDCDGNWECPVQTFEIVLSLCCQPSDSRDITQPQAAKAFCISRWYIKCSHPGRVGHPDMS